ncbi:MAG: hypothetical protein ICV81_10725 [Flavisolibacter sp.]|nr:hypothetical protein [Flavisolibacter sp.]
MHYKITPDIEASWNSYLGTGTTVYTGIDRYSLKNLKMAQHKLEVRATNWFVRGYTTQENAGDSYANTVLGRLINEAWKPSQQWYPEYVAAFVKARSPVSQGGFGAGDYAAHLAARNFADSGRALPGTTQFNQYKQSISGIPIPRGARFLDRTDLWAGEAQVNLSDVLKFSEMFDVITGAQWKQYVLNSQGTVFADTSGRIRIAETGGYVQVRKKLQNELLTLTAAARYDKHTNFKGRFTPRLTAVVRVAPENYFRVSYQTGYRFPTNQDQYINLNSSANTYLIGFLRRFFEAYNLYNNPGYTPESVAQFRATGNESVLQMALLNDVKPESVSSFEVGYKGVMTKKVFLDAYTYYSHYTNFLAGVGAFQSLTGSAPGLLNPATTRQFGYIQNSNQNVKAYGWGVTIEYQLPMRFIIYGNVYSDKLVIDSGNGNNVVSSKEREVQFPGIFFNTPDYRFNLGVRNENVYRNIGFNVIYKWQSENYYEGTFISGTLPSFGWLDAQVTYKVPKSKSMVRIGGTNILNNYQRTAYGNPYVGGLYYVSYGYNIF